MIHRTSGSINVFSYTTCERRLVHDVLRRSRLDSLWKCTTSTQISGWRSWTLRSCAVKKPQRKIHLCSSFWNWVNFCQRRQPFRWPRKIKENSSLQFFLELGEFQTTTIPLSTTDPDAYCFVIHIYNLYNLYNLYNIYLHNFRTQLIQLIQHIPTQLHNTTYTTYTTYTYTTDGAVLWLDKPSNRGWLLQPSSRGWLLQSKVET